MFGQINRGSSFGDLLFEISSRKDVKSIVEIGTWNGLGSTKCIFDALKLRFDDCKLYSLESNLEMYSQAKKYWDNIFISFDIFKDKLELIHGRIIEVEDLISLESIKVMEDYKSEWDIWFNDDIKSISSCPNVLDLLPSKIDFLLLDGGEFSTLSEFKLLGPRSKIIACDDTNVLKCREIRSLLLSDSSFKCLNDSPFDRNGFSIFERVT